MLTLLINFLYNFKKFEYFDATCYNILLVFLKNNNIFFSFNIRHIDDTFRQIILRIKTLK